MITTARICAGDQRTVTLQEKSRYGVTADVVLHVA